jgi:hypothetical protein
MVEDWLLQEETNLNKKKRILEHTKMRMMHCTDFYDGGNGFYEE